MGGVCGIGSIKGRLSPIGSLQGALSIPVGGGLDCDIYEGEYNIVQLFFCCDVIRTVSWLVRIRIDSGSENIIDQTVNIVVRSHLTPFGKTSGVCLDYNIMLQQFVGCRQYLNRVAGNDAITDVFG